MLLRRFVIGVMVVLLALTAGLAWVNRPGRPDIEQAVRAARSAGFTNVEPAYQLGFTPTLTVTVGRSCDNVQIFYYGPGRFKAGETTVGSADKLLETEYYKRCAGSQEEPEGG